MTKEEIINKAIELEFGSGNAKSIRESNSSLVKVAEHLYDLMKASLPSNLDEAAEEYMGTIRQFGDASFTLYADVDVKNGFKAGAEWMAGQGITLECLIDYKSGALVGIDSVPTQETLKDYCNKIGASRVIVQIRKKQ